VEATAGPFIVVDEALIDRTIARPAWRQRGGQRVLLHPDLADSLHRDAHRPAPRKLRHPTQETSSSESFHVVRGAMAVMLFSVGRERGERLPPVRERGTARKAAA
jgi:hypothetical protein